MRFSFRVFQLTAAELVKTHMLSLWKDGWTPNVSIVTRRTAALVRVLDVPNWPLRWSYWISLSSHLRFYSSRNTTVKMLRVSCIGRCAAVLVLEVPISNTFASPNCRVVNAFEIAEGVRLWLTHLSCIVAQCSCIGFKSTECETVQTELWSCVKVEVAVLGSTSLIVFMVFVDVKQQWTWTITVQRKQLFALLKRRFCIAVDETAPKKQ